MTVAVDKLHYCIWPGTFRPILRSCCALTDPCCGSSRAELSTTKTGIPWWPSMPVPEVGRVYVSVSVPTDSGWAPIDHGWHGIRLGTCCLCLSSQPYVGPGWLATDVSMMLPTGDVRPIMLLSSRVDSGFEEVR